MPIDNSSRLTSCGRLIKRLSHLVTVLPKSPSFAPGTARLRHDSLFFQSARQKIEKQWTTFANTDQTFSKKIADKWVEMNEKEKETFNLLKIDQFQKRNGCFEQTAKLRLVSNENIHELI